MIDVSPAGTALDVEVVIPTYNEVVAPRLTEASSRETAMFFQAAPRHRQ